MIVEAAWRSETRSQWHKSIKYCTDFLIHFCHKINDACGIAISYRFIVDSDRQTELILNNAKMYIASKYDCKFL